jgi:hypothetical protein
MIKGQRIGLTPDNDTREKLIRLALACRKHPTTMAMDLIKLCVNNPNIIEFVQRINGVDERYKVKCRIEGDTVIYE